MYCSRNVNNFSAFLTLICFVTVLSFMYKLQWKLINAAKVIEDLRVPPNNRLEQLKGNLKEYHSIRINDQYRVIFKWKDNNAYDVDIVDYH